jgi:lipopolysaccharide export system permease protein
MKQVDRLVLRSFLPPFVVSFLIASFVLVMQMLWLYIDDIAGKGLGLMLVLELLFYRSVGIIPMSLPLGILLASVMTLGAMGEHFELSSFKSGGISLFRIMRAILIFGLFAILFSLYCSNTLIPVANLKFGSRMFDIKQKKPALRLEAGIFNDDLEGYAIHIGKKKSDGKSIEDILIYDHTASNVGRYKTVKAQKGELTITKDGKYMIMLLENGMQYLENGNNLSPGEGKYPYSRTKFLRWQKVFDLSEFELSRTNEGLFKGNRSMMSSGELATAVDSIVRDMDKKGKEMGNYMVGFLPYLQTDSLYLAKVPETAPAEAIPESNPSFTKPAISEATASPDPYQYTPDLGTPVKQLPGIRSDTLSRLLNAFVPFEQPQLSSKAKSIIRTISTQSGASAESVRQLNDSRVKHIYDLNAKYSIAVACFLFVLIGAPMGAIVRKGGFGYPILISTLFFMVFVVLTIVCRKIAESLIIPAEAAAWLPNLILFPIAMILTWLAMNDSSFSISLGFKLRKNAAPEK